MEKQNECWKETVSQVQFLCKYLWILIIVNGDKHHDSGIVSSDMNCFKMELSLPYTQ